jgi:hypothetical protein
MTLEGSLDQDNGYMTGDEIWSIHDRRESGNIWSGALFNIARGFQNASNPYMDDWVSMYIGIRCCNTLIEKVGDVPDLPEWEKLQWIAEAKFLKAWYHFHLMRKWGPVPIIRESLPINASVEEVRVSRDPMEECFDYVLQLLEEAIPDLPIETPAITELGRITRPAAAAVRAKIAVFAASPLFNNNRDQSTLENKDGTKLFKTDKTDEEVKARWDSAVIACKKAIDICHEGGMSLYRFQSRISISDTLMREMDLRNAVNEKWNSEIIWTNACTALGLNENLQRAASPNLQSTEYPDMPLLYSHIQPPLKIAEMYYTRNGLPIENDVSWDTIAPYDLRDGDASERWYIRNGYTTIKFNFGREPRFYAWLGFDGGLWYAGQKAEINNPVPGDLYWISCRAGGAHQKKGYDWGPVTGYFLKKVVNYKNRQTSAAGYSCERYPWPMMRLADLYLLYAEAINESEGPNGANSAEMFRYIDLVRERAGVPKVKEAWDSYSNVRGKYSTREGMKEIIHRERLIELSFEGQRFWDLRRWKEAPAEYAKGIYGFKVTAAKPEDYYQKIPIAEQKFSLKDYFWPIRISTLEGNPNLVQNLGW